MSEDNRVTGLPESLSGVLVGLSGAERFISLRGGGGVPSPETPRTDVGGS